MFLITRAKTKALRRFFLIFLGFLWYNMRDNKRIKYEARNYRYW